MNKLLEISRESFACTCRLLNIPEASEEVLWGTAFNSGKLIGQEEMLERITREMPIFNNPKTKEASNEIQGT